jgi:hypothetical protein
LRQCAKGYREFVTHRNSSTMPIIESLIWAGVNVTDFYQVLQFIKNLSITEELKKKLIAMYEQETGKNIPEQIKKQYGF